MPTGVYQRTPGQIRIPMEERFWAKVDKDGPVPEFATHLGKCWLWTAAKWKGYGSLSWPASRRLVKAHRFAYELLVDAIPADLHLDHLCRNPSCVNPAHLEPVTPRENTLRGLPFRSRRLKTHCKHGHPFDEANTRVRPDGRRYCHACMREHSRAAYLRRREAAKNLDLPPATARNGVQRNADGDGAPLSPSASLWDVLAEPGPKTPEQLANIHYLTCAARPEVRHNSVGGAQRNGPDSTSPLLADPGHPLTGPDAA